MARQHNISEAHLFHFKNALAHRSEFSLILEDDFDLNRFLDYKHTVEKVIEFLLKNKNIQIISLSESFDLHYLGISNISKEEFYDNLIFYIQSIPVTNTVCAVMYKQSILNYLVPELESFRKYKIIPIDHKINIALAKMRKKNYFNQNFFTTLSPGIFLQKSLHV